MWPGFDRWTTDFAPYPLSKHFAGDNTYLMQYSFWQARPSSLLF